METNSNHQSTSSTDSNVKFTGHFTYENNARTIINLCRLVLRVNVIPLAGTAFLTEHSLHIGKAHRSEMPQQLSPPICGGVGSHAYDASSVFDSRNKLPTGLRSACILQTLFS